MSFLESVGKPSVRPSDTTVFNFLIKHLEPVDVVPMANGSDSFDAALRPDSCESIEELVAALVAKLSLPSASIDVFKIMLATIISLKINGPLLWLHCVGPSSSLKTTLLGIVASSYDKCFMASNFNGLYSGFKTKGEDPSLAPKLQNKCLIIPDLTPLLSSPKEQQDRVFGELRDIYDGRGRRVYGNGEDRNYEGVVFTVISGVTDRIKKAVRTDMGERFVMAEINANWTADGRLVQEEVKTEQKGNAYDSVLETIIAGFDDSEALPSMDSLAPERAKCWGLLNHLFEWMSDESHNLADCARTLSATKELKQQIEALAIWMEVARCPLPIKGDDTGASLRPALPHRTIKVLTKYTVALCVVHKTTTLTPEIRRLICKIGFDSAAVHDAMEIMNILAVKGAQDKIMLAMSMNRSPPHIAFICNHLQRMTVVEMTYRKNNGSGVGGAPAACFKLTPNFRLVANTIGLVEETTAQKIFRPKPAPKPLGQVLAGASFLSSLSSLSYDSASSTPSSQQTVGSTTPKIGFMSSLRKKRVDNKNLEES